MKATARLLGAAIVSILALTSAPSADLKSFDWLAGTWKRESRGGEIHETWKILGERTLEGRSYFVASATGERRLSEALLLAEMGGEIFYIPRPMENPYPVAFKLVSLEGKIAVFENPEHDFPQRILYTRNENGSMTVSIEGPAEGHDRPRRIDFQFVRAD